MSGLHIDHARKIENYFKVTYKTIEGTSISLLLKTICSNLKLKRTLEKLSRRSLVYSYHVIVKQMQSSCVFWTLYLTPLQLSICFIPTVLVLIITGTVFVDYNKDSFKILNLKWRFFVIIWRMHCTRRFSFTSMYLFLKKRHVHLALKLPISDYQSFDKLIDFISGHWGKRKSFLYWL